MNRLNAVFLFLSFLFFITGCKQENEVDLRFNLQKGKSYNYSIETDTSTELDTTRKNKSAMSYAYTIEVLNDSNGIKTLKTTYNRIMIKMNLPNAVFDIDTDQPRADTSSTLSPADMIQGMFHAIKGKSFFMKVDPAGKVLQISGLTEMANDMINGLQLDDNLRPMVQQAFTQQFNEENLKQLFKQAFEIYPDKPVGEGDTWSKTVSMKAIQMNSNTEYRVKSISNGTVLIDASSDLDMSGFKGTENASFEVDAATGLVRKSTSTQKFDEPMKMTTVTKIKGEER